MRSALIVFLAAFTLISLLPVVTAQNAETPACRQDIIMGVDGKPSLQITNDSESPIAAFVRVDFSTGL